MSATHNEPQLPYFWETETPVLDLDRDEWFSTVVPLSVQVDPGLITRLNCEVDVSLGNPEAVDRAERYKDDARGHSRSTGAFQGALRLAKRQATQNFSIMAGIPDPESPFHAAIRRSSMIRPIAWVATTRLFSRHVGLDDLPVVAKKATDATLYAYTIDMVAYRLQLVQEAGIDIAQLLLTWPRLLKGDSSDPEKFMAAAQRGMTSRRVRTPREQQLPIVAARPTASRPEILSDAARERFEQLKEVTGFPLTDLMEVLCDVPALDQTTFDGLMGRLEDMAAHDCEIRWRDLLRDMPKAQPDSDT